MLAAAAAACVLGGSVRGAGGVPSPSRVASVYLKDGQYSVKFGVFDKSALAYGNYTDMMDNPISLFGTLDIETNPSGEDTQQVRRRCSAPGCCTALPW